MSEVCHANPNGKFAIEELRYSWRSQFPGKIMCGVAKKWI
jgi:hypothetical protein